MDKTRINISMDRDLAEFVKIFAAENRTTVANIMTQYALALKRQVEGRSARQVLSNPAFARAMEEARRKLRSGKARWYSYDEVFED